MKKLNKVGKTIALSTVAAIAFGGVALTTTYALFTSEANTSVTVSSGKVKVSTDVILTGAKTLDNGEEKEVEATDDKSVTFGAGGTATVLDDGNVKLSNIVAGDYVTVQVTAKSQSNVNIKYRLVVTNSGDADFNKIVTLVGKDGDNVEMKKSENGLFTKYKTAVATDSEQELGIYSFTFGIDKETVVNDGEAREGEISIKLEAIQGNAKTEDLQEYFAATTSTELADTITNADPNSIIEIASEIELEDTLNVNKDLNIVLADDVTAPSTKNAFNVTDGATLTIGTKSTSGSSAKGAIKNVVDGPVITAKNDAILADGGNVVVNGGSIISTDGNGIVAINDGNVTVKGGYVKAQEVALLAHSSSSITVNDGIFETVDNFVVGTNGTTNWGNNTITINGGTFNGNITSKGYIACGVYVANSDTVKINAGTFNIENGCGVLARSGNTTVSDDVVFNFTNTEDGVTSGQVGDKESQVPVNARVVQDLSLPSYPGGEPVVSATGVVAIHQTSGKTYLVSTEEELKAAIADSSNLTTKYIFVKNDIDLNTATKSSYGDDRIALDIKSKNTYIYGNGVTIKNTNKIDPRVINVFGDENENLKDGSLTIAGVNLYEWDTNGEWANRRCINLYQTTNYTLTIDGCNIVAEHYAIQQKNSTGSKISVKNSYVQGYGCLYNITGTNTKDGVTAVFENTTLFGNNYYPENDQNEFANIDFDGSPSNVVNNLTFNKCNFIMYSKCGNLQKIADIASSSDNINMNGCSFIAKNDEGETPITGTNLDNYLNSPSWFIIDGVKTNY